MSARTDAVTAWQSLAADPLVRLTAALLVFAAVPYVVPLLPAGRMAQYSRAADIPLLVVAIFAFQSGLRRLPDQRLRRVWHLLTAALASWLVVRGVQLVLGAGAVQSMGHEVVVDILYLVFYLFFILALEFAPRTDRDEGPVPSLRNLRSAGATVFALGLLAYFVIIPGAINPAAYTTQAPSLLLFVTLDLYIVGRLVAHRVHCRARPWSTACTLLLTTAVLWVLTDLAEAMEYTGVWALGTGTATDLAWLPAWLTLVGAARAPHVVPASPAPERADLTGGAAPTGGAGSLLVFAVVVPATHFALSGLGLLDPVSKPAREVCALVVMLVLAALAAMHQTLLQRENQRLAADRDAVARRLHGLQRVEAIGRLAGGIAHVNNLLTIILTNAGLMEASLRSGHTDVLDDLDELTAAARRGTSMVKKLLGVGRRDLLMFRPVDLAEVVRGFYPALRRIVDPSIEMRFDADAGVRPARADAGAVEQILMNLVANASDAMPNGGLLRIEVRQGRPGGAPAGVAAPSAPAAEVVTLTVTDTGVGMDERTREQVFEPFFTTKPAGEGTGLGLAMVYGLTKQHGGWVYVASAPERGTQVRVLIPTWPDNEAPPAAPPGQAEPSATRAILVVEDEAPIRRAAQRSLERMGYRVLVAANGEDALRVFEVHAGEIALVVSDVVMPRLSGVKLREAVQRLRPGTRFIFTSGYAGADLPAEHGLDPQVPFLSKPWTMEELASKVKEAIGAQ
ncbi:MAG TPA: ATP-binding protein [Gemmatimonadales bacterium]